MVRKFLILVLILTLVFLIGHYQMGLFEPYNWITAKRDISNGQIQLIIYGELDHKEELRNIIANELGFDYFRPTDYAIDQPFIKGVSFYNNQVMEYLNKHNPAWEQQLNLRLQQLSGYVIFDQDKPFEILSLKQLSNYPSSDSDTSYCADWKLPIDEAINILKFLKPISGSDWHHLFEHYPCVHLGTLTQNSEEFEFAINAGSWLTISSDTTIYYGDLKGTFKELFIGEVWNEENQK